MAQVSVRLLGGFELAHGPDAVVHLPTRKAQALFAYLAMRPDQLHPRDKLAALLWGDVPDAQARASLRQTLSLIGKALDRGPAPCLVTEGRAVGLASDAVDLDVTRFESAAADAAPEALERVVGLYRGAVLEGIVVDEPAFEAWLLTERERLHEMAIEALGRLLAHHEAPGGSVERAIQAALRLVALDPCQETVHRALMRLYARRGRHASALRQYQACVTALRRELNAEPEAETKRVYREIVERRQLPVSEPAPPRADTPVRDTPLVGRSGELATLLAALDESRGGRGRAAVVIGEPGIGKSRLVEELAAAATSRSVQVLLGRCFESEQILPFAPWIGALRAAGVAADSPVVQALPAGTLAALQRVFPEVAPAAEPVADNESPLRLFHALTALLVALAGRTPLLVVLEDVHWADDMSLRFLTVLSRRLASERILAVATMREEPAAGESGLRRTLHELRAQPGFVALSLAPLSTSDVAALVRALARSGADDATVASFVSHVWRTSEGNPFVAVETMRAIQEAGPHRGAFAIPGTVRDMVAHRLDQLGDNARRVLAVAAVADGVLDVDLLHRAAGLPMSHTADALEELVRRRVLHGVGDGFGFVHDRVRHVANASLLSARRVAVHTAIAEALESLHDGSLEAVYDRLAHHWGETDRADKAVESLGRFAAAAARNGGHVEAIAAVERGLAHVPRLRADARPRARLDLLFGKARSLFYSGRFHAVLDVLRDEEAAVIAQGDPRRAAMYYFLCAVAATYTGDHGAAVDDAARSLERATECEDTAAMGRARFILALESVFRAPAEGITHGEEAIRLLARGTDRAWLGQAHWVLAANLTYRGRIGDALAELGRARAIADALGDRRLQGFVAGTTGLALAMAGDFPAAIASCQQAVAVAVDPLNGMTTRAFLALVYLEAGDVVGARPVLDEALSQARGFRHAYMEGLLCALHAHATLVEGHVGRARAMANEALAITRASGYAYALGWAQRIGARIAKAEGHGARSEQVLSEAAATFEAMGALYEVGRTALELAETLDMRGDRAGAAAHAARAATLARELGLDALGARAARLS